MRPGSSVFSAGFSAALLTLTIALGACSNGGSSAPPADAGIPSYQVIGAPCDPAARPPCEVLSDVCTVSQCDPTMHVCVRVAVDGGPTCGNGVPPPPPTCTGDCDAGAGDSALVDGADAADASDAGDAGTDAGSQDATDDAASLDSSLDAPAEAGDAAGD
ncbi:MAG TPA: hypothetical protein VGI39_01800 [Polyangiaceae bacterium]